MCGPSFRLFGVLRRSPVQSLLLAVLLTTLFDSGRSAGVAGENWGRFRGPGALGVSADENLPVEWSETKNVAWKTAVEGRGWSSPIVWGSRVYLTTAVSEQEEDEYKRGLYFGGNRSQIPEAEHHWKVVCLDLNSGERIWERIAHRGRPSNPLHVKNSYASETPVTDGERVYAYFGNVGLFCYTMDGEPVWSERWEPVKTRYDWGTAASPVLHDDRVYVVNDNEQQSYLVALDKATGERIWRVEREEKSNWATPFVWKNELRTEIITPGTGRFRSYDLDGKPLYEFGGASTITIATPYVANGLLYVSSGYILDDNKPIFAIRPGASGDISLEADQTSNEHVVWCQKQAAPYNPTTIVHDGLLYVLLDRGFLTCHDARTGELVYDRQRLPGGQAFTASPWAHGDKIFCLNEYGKTYVVAAGREFELLHTNTLADEPICMATPAMAGDRLVLRTDKHLYCIRRARVER